jgi:hypothetical protein
MLTTRSGPRLRPEWEKPSYARRSPDGSEFLHDGVDPTQAARRAIELLQRRTSSEAGLIVIDALGRIGYAHNAPAMSVAFRSGETLVVRALESTPLCVPPIQF